MFLTEVVLRVKPSAEGRENPRSRPTLRKLQTLLRRMDALKVSLKEAQRLVATSIKLKKSEFKSTDDNT